MLPDFPSVFPNLDDELPFPPSSDDITASTPARFNHSHHNSLASASSALEPFASTPPSSKPMSSSRTPSSSFPSRALTKRSLKDIFAEGSVRDAELIERLGAQKHERALGQLELKRRKLEQKELEERHRREQQHEEHEYRMMQMRVMMAQRPTDAPPMPQPPAQSQAPFEGFGLLNELNSGVLPPSRAFPDASTPF
jgi:hypothetical protein